MFLSLYIISGQNMYGIKDLRTGQYVQQEDGLIVNCSSYKAFWIKWDDGLLRVGEGMTIFLWDAEIYIICMYIELPPEWGAFL